jgi:hypothetical protein
MESKYEIDWKYILNLSWLNTTNLAQLFLDNFKVINKRLIKYILIKHHSAKIDQEEKEIRVMC